MCAYFSAPHLLLVLVVPGFLAVLGHPSLQCLLVALSDLLDHRDPAEMSQIRSKSQVKVKVNVYVCVRYARTLSPFLPWSPFSPGNPGGP